MNVKFGINLDEANQEVQDVARIIVEEQEASMPVTSEDIDFVIGIMMI